MRFYCRQTLGSAFLVGGTAIGAGMLALPLVTGAGGFFYSILTFLLVFLFMLATLFFLLEATLMTEGTNVNLISMCNQRLGRVGAFIAWVSFLLLLYSVAAAYLSGGGSLVANMIQSFFHFSVSTNCGIVIFLFIFGGIVAFETKAIDLLNRICMIGLIASFIFLCISVAPQIKMDHYRGGEPQFLLVAIPVIALSFTSHIIVPSLRNYLRGDIAKLKRALLWGSVIPLVFYLIWEWVIVGMFPLSGPHSLESIGSAAYPVARLIDVLNVILDASWIVTVMELFSFFSLVTSFFGVALSLYDFLSDGLGIQKTTKGKLSLLVFMFTPPLFFSLFYPNGFVVALSYAGIFVAILYGILPGLIVWHGRYIAKERGEFRVVGGKLLLLLIFLGSLAIIVLQVAATRGWLPAPYRNG